MGQENSSTTVMTSDHSLGSLVLSCHVARIKVLTRLRILSGDYGEKSPTFTHIIGKMGFLMPI